ncbi:MAG TPA: ABC transporter ATP-binding protein [Candidatus Angelobacter sp.]
MIERRPRLAALLTQTLAGHADIVSVYANPITGRVLVFFHPERESIREILLDALLKTLQQFKLFLSGKSLANAGASGPSLLTQFSRPLLITATAVVLPAVWGVAAAMPPLYIGAALIGIAGVVFQRWRLAHSTVSPLVRLQRYAAPYRRRIYIAIACSVLDKLLDLVPALLIGTSVNVVMQRGSPIFSALGFSSIKMQLLALGAASVAVWFLEAITGYAHRMLWQSVAQDIQHRLRVDAYAHIQRLEMSTLESQRTGDLAAILNDDVNRLQLFVSDDVNHLIQTFTNAVALGLAFLILAPSVAWLALLPLPIVIWSALRYQDSINPVYRKIQAKAGRLSAQLVNNLGGIATIKSFTAEESESKRIQLLSNDYRDSSSLAITKSSAFAPLIRLPILVGFAGTMVVGGLLVSAARLEAGTYATVVFLTQRFLWPLTSLGRSLDSYQSAMASVERALNLLDIPPGVPDEQGEPLNPENVRGEIEFRQVQFGYHDGIPVLHDINLRIPATKTHAIVGPTGSGKSTLIKLLLRFCEPQSGSIYLDGREIRKLRARDLRRVIGLVNQDFFLIDGTIRENIEFGRPGAPFEAIVEAATVAEAHEFIEQQVRGYETLVGERGVNLSTGQRQRICIARAVLKDPPIFVFDEATSAVDNETEAAIQRSLERISRGRTMILIAHRLSTVRRADHISVLDTQGHIVEEGTHEQLVRQKGLYASLWRVQSMGSHRLDDALKGRKS